MGACRDLVRARPAALADAPRHGIVDPPVVDHASMAVRVRPGRRLVGRGGRGRGRWTALQRAHRPHPCRRTVRSADARPRASQVASRRVCGAPCDAQSGRDPPRRRREPDAPRADRDVDRVRARDVAAQARSADRDQAIDQDLGRAHRGRSRKRARQDRRHRRMVRYGRHALLGARAVAARRKVGRRAAVRKTRGASSTTNVGTPSSGSRTAAMLCSGGALRGRGRQPSAAHAAASAGGGAPAHVGLELLC